MLCLPSGQKVGASGPAQRLSALQEVGWTVLGVLRRNASMGWLTQLYSDIVWIRKLALWAPRRLEAEFSYIALR